MKFIHLADLHIGKTVKEFSMIEDQEYVLDRVVNIAKDEDIDAVLISGDVYDRSIPSEEAVRVFDEFIYRLSEIPVKVLLISGNHDSDERLNFGSRLFEDKDIYFCTKYDGHLYKQTFEDEFGPLNFYLLPFVKASQVRYFFPQEILEDYDKAVRTVIEKAEIDRSERNVILAHQFVTGDSSGVILGGSESAATVNVGNVEMIKYDCFDPFDYAALGHIHRAQKAGREEVRYAGTLLKYHIDEVDNENTIPIITMKEKGNLDIELRPVKPLRNMRRIKGPINKLLSAENLRDTDDYIFAILTDENPVNDAMTIFRRYYPNTLQIKYENSHTKELEMTEAEGYSEARSFTEIIGDFYRFMYKRDISEEEMAVMKEAAGKAGIS
ncbi:MAG: exonuclease SbcCD subunit D [Lachnospiraceae bacterium]|nr:exonuclease SbcCD subunit D [Lachnospiraceae bacterium]